MSAADGSPTPAPESSEAPIPSLAPVAEGEARPFWSVIVPLYGRRQFLKQCLDSVLDQDPGPEAMEILVVDDASEEDLQPFVESLGRGRVTFLRNTTTLGLYPSTNAAIGKARGRWVHLLHDDDWVLPGFYATLRGALENAAESVGVACTMYTNQNDMDGTTWVPQPMAPAAGLLGSDFFVRLAQVNPLNLPAVVFRREAFEKVGLFREDLPYTADWEWYVRSALQFGWYHEPASLARYRVHTSNHTHILAREGRTVRDIRRTLELFSEMLPADFAARVLPPARDYFARLFLTMAQSALQAGHPHLARILIGESLALDVDGAGRPEFVQLLQNPGYSALRREVREALLPRGFGG